MEKIRINQERLLNQISHFDKTGKKKNSLMRIALMKSKGQLTKSQTREQNKIANDSTETPLDDYLTGIKLKKIDLNKSSDDFV